MTDDRAERAALWELVDTLYDGITAAVARLSAYEPKGCNRDLTRLVENAEAQRALLRAGTPEEETMTTERHINLTTWLFLASVVAGWIIEGPTAACILGAYPLLVCGLLWPKA
jgi:hypothetical protein